MIFLSLPLALAGVAGIFWATRHAFTREAAVGVILVVGLAVNQSILLVDAALERRKDGRTESRKDGRTEGRKVDGGRTDPPSVVPSFRLTTDDIIAAASDRAGMILLVTLTTLASLVPLAIGTDADSLFGSIALATAGGTIAGTIGALWIVPAYLVGRRRPRSAV
jgi:HAE1 family hydrophobic/amphiphilic exporter-1